MLCHTATSSRAWAKRRRGARSVLYRWKYRKKIILPLIKKQDHVSKYGILDHEIINSLTFWHHILKMLIWSFSKPITFWIHEPISLTETVKQWYRNVLNRHRKFQPHIVKHWQYQSEATSGLDLLLSTQLNDVQDRKSNRPG